MKTVNLLPGSDEAVRGATLRRATKCSGGRFMIIGCGAWFIAGVLHWTILGWDIRVKERELAWQTATENAAIQLLQQNDSIERMTAEVHAMRDGVPMEAALALMSQLMPEGTRLDSMVVRRLDGGRPGKEHSRSRRGDALEVSVSGSSDTDASIAGFIAALSESRYLRRVRTREQSQRENGQHFMISMEMHDPSGTRIVGVKP